MHLITVNSAIPAIYERPFILSIMQLKACTGPLEVKIVSPEAVKVYRYIDKDIELIEESRK